MKKNSISFFFLIVCINAYADEKILFQPEINPFAYIYDEEKDSSGIMHYEYGDGLKMEKLPIQFRKEIIGRRIQDLSGGVFSILLKIQQFGRQKQFKLEKNDGSNIPKYAKSEEVSLRMKQKNMRNWNGRNYLKHPIICTKLILMCSF